MMLKSLRLVPALALLSASPAAAAEEGGLLSPQGGLVFWTIVVFVVVLAVLYKLAFPYILGAVEAREERIRELLAAAARDREEAQAYLDQHQKQLEETRAQTQEIFADARASAERLRDEMLADARREQEALRERARREIDMQVEQAMDAVRREAAVLAIAAAEKLIQRNLDDEQNRRLVQDFLGQVERERPSVPAGV